MVYYFFMASKQIKVNGGYPLHTFEQLEDLYENYKEKIQISNR